MMADNLTLDPTGLDLNRKLDKLTTQIEFLTEEALRQKRRQQEFDELKADLTPIFNDVFRLSVTQLQEVEQHAQIEDILNLFKRLLRNTRNLEQMLDQLESVMELWQDAGPLSRDAFLSFLQQLEAMEQKGYFTFLQGGLQMMDKVVTAFDKKDIDQLADNIVLILQTVKEMTQPEIMDMLQRTAVTMTDEEPADTSIRGIVRQLNDPAVRTGLAKTLTILKNVGEKQ